MPKVRRKKNLNAPRPRASPSNLSPLFLLTLVENLTYRILPTPLPQKLASQPTVHISPMFCAASMPSSASPSPSVSDSPKPRLWTGASSGGYKYRGTQFRVMPVCENFIYRVTSKAQFSPRTVHQPITSRCGSSLRIKLPHSRPMRQFRGNTV